MKKTLHLLAGMAVIQSASAAAVIVDFTAPAATSGNPDTGAGIDVSSNPIFDDFDFGGGRSADISVVAAGATIGSISVGVGATGGTQGGRIGLDEDLTITFSDFKGGLVASDIQFVGFVASTFASSGVFSLNAGDTFLINGTALTATDAGDGAHTPDLNYGSLDSYVYQDADSLVDLNGSDALLLDLTSDDGSGYRLQGIRLEVVPEPSSVALIGLGMAGLVIRRRR